MPASAPLLAAFDSSPNFWSLLLPVRVSRANVTLPPLEADASLGRDLFRMMLVGAAAVGLVAVAGRAGPAVVGLFVVAESCDGGGTAAAADIGMTLGIVMSVKSGAGPASTESMGTVTRLGIFVAVAFAYCFVCYCIVMALVGRFLRLTVFAGAIRFNVCFQSP